MLSKHAVRLLAAALGLAVSSVPGLAAATRTNALSISANVVASCNVTPGVAALTSTAAGQSAWTTSTAVDCTMPVAYQVLVNGSAASSPPQGVSSTMLPYAPSRTRDFFRVVGLPPGQYVWSGLPDSELVMTDTFGSSLRLDDFAGALWPDPYSGRVIVTIVF